MAKTFRPYASLPEPVDKFIQRVRSKLDSLLNGLDLDLTIKYPVDFGSLLGIPLDRYGQHTL